MKGAVSKALLLLTFFLILFILPKFISPQTALGQDPTVLTNEIMPYPNEGEDEWIELFNPDNTESVDLSGMWIVVHKGTEPNYTYYQRIDLSGTLPRQGFLTFSFPPDNYKLPDDGACISIFTGPTTSIFSLKYGNGTCDPGVSPVDATDVGVERGKSINAQTTWNTESDPPQATWTLSSTPSKGWCDVTDPQCFQVSNLTDALEAEGVTSNIADQGDLSRTSNLYFERSGYGKIAFANEINLTDRDAMTWMQLLDEKLSISQRVISLDAELIKNLVDTQATLTMYNITLNNPTIRVTNTDGTPGDSSIVSGLTYDRDSGILTFTAAHFTTFEAVEAEVTSETTTTVSETTTTLSPANPPACNDWPPSNAPHLFQIDTTAKEATLYFTPVNDYLSYYYIAYGFSEGDERFGVEFPASLSTGVESYVVGNLSPQTTYYFKVRGGNGCAPGPWSNWLGGRTESETKETSLVVKKAVFQREEQEKTRLLPPEIERGIKEATGVGEKKVSVVEKQPAKPLETPPSEKISFWQALFDFLRRLFGR